MGKAQVGLVFDALISLVAFIRFLVTLGRGETFATVLTSTRSKLL